MLTLGVAHAQTIPGEAQPGRPLRDVEPAAEPRPATPVITLPAMPPSATAPAGSEAQQLSLRSVSIEGNSALSSESLAPLWQADLGQTVSLARLYAITNAITTRYREAGYVLSQAILPPQDMQTAGADVRIRVIEGYVSDVQFTGAKVEETALRPFVAPILAERPLSLGTLERQLLLLNELAGITARASLQASSAPGAAALDIEALQQKSASSFSVHNRTSRALGPWRFEAGTELRGMLGAFDRHALRWIGSGNNRLNLIAYNGETPLGAQGLKLNWSFSASRAKPMSTLLNIDSDSRSFGLGASYPIIRRRSLSLGVRGGLSSYRGSTDTPVGQLSSDRIHAFRLGMTLDTVDSLRGINLLDLEYAQGFSGSSLLGADTRFKKFTLYAARLQSLGSPWSLLMAASGQHSSDVLASSEKFGLGGETFLRAFDPSELLGDSGLAAKLELRRQMSLGGHEATLYLYQDVGKVQCNGTVACAGYTGSGRYSRSLSATGLGARFTLSNRLRGFVEVAKPHLKTVDSRGNDKVRLFAGLGFDF